MKKGWNEALRLGVSKEDLKKTVKNSVGISIFLSIPIVITARNDYLFGSSVVLVAILMFQQIIY